MAKNVSLKTLTKRVSRLKNGQKQNGVFKNGKSRSFYLLNLLHFDVFKCRLQPPLINMMEGLQIFFCNFVT